MNRSENAVAHFMEGFRCSQAVLGVYAEGHDMDIDLARKISLGLAAGSGNGGECGAVTGAYLAIGLKYGFSHPGDPDAFHSMFDRIQNFTDRFKELHKEIDCPKLIGLDVLSPEGHQKFVENGIKKTRCAEYVRDAVRILEDIL
jgi:C_GCAxxG_C_C family probable redox protein